MWTVRSLIVISIFRLGLVAAIALNYPVGFAPPLAQAADAIPSERPAPVATPVPDGLAKYLAKPEPKFDWKLVGEQAVGSVRIYRLQLTSQTWQGIDWSHALYVFEPEKLRHPEQMLLFITGGKDGQPLRPEEVLTGSILAEMCGARVATLNQVPNQPLFGGRVEDDLITDTWLKYLETGDESWPLLFPMVKSALKAMDALQQFSQSQWQQPVQKFVVTGASKRGWTTWLTAAMDSRVAGAAPMVIDFLNFQEQMRRQKQVWGRYSEQIIDYTRKGLIKDDGEPRTAREERLWAMMDPFSYRAKLKQPKLIVVGANDRYWLHDAMNVYWDELQGPKAALRIPNAGHNLQGGRELVMTTVGAFFRHVATDTPFPVVVSELTETDGRFKLSIFSDQRPQRVKLWKTVANSPDFRDAEWSDITLQANTAGSYTTGIEKTNGTHVAVFGECQFLHDELLYSVSTLLHWR